MCEISLPSPASPRTTMARDHFFWTVPEKTAQFYHQMTLNSTY
jgi:hypothetical protein